MNTTPRSKHTRELACPVEQSVGRCPSWSQPRVGLGIGIDLRMTLTSALTFLASKMSQDRAGLQTWVLEAGSTAFSIITQVGFAMGESGQKELELRVGALGGRSEWHPSEVGHWEGPSGWWASLRVCSGPALPETLLIDPSSLAPDLSWPWSDHLGFYMPRHTSHPQALASADNCARRGLYGLDSASFLLGQYRAQLIAVTTSLGPLFCILPVGSSLAPSGGCFLIPLW